MSLSVESYKNLAVLSLGFFWAFISILVWRLKIDKSTSISGHIAANKKVSVFFGVISLLVAPLLLVFFIKWFTPTFHFGWVFNVLIAVIWFLYFVAGVVPDTKGLAHKIHRRAALAASMLLVPAMVIMVANNHIGTFARVFMIFGLLIMLVTGAELRKNNYTSDKFLIYQAVYFLSFDISIIIATYVR